MLGHLLAQRVALLVKRKPVWITIWLLARTRLRIQEKSLPPSKRMNVIIKTIEQKKMQEHNASSSQSSMRSSLTAEQVRKMNLFQR